MGKIDTVRLADILGPRRAQMAMFQADAASLPVFGLSHQREFDRSPWPIRVFDHETLRYIAVNDAALAFYGYSREEFLQLSISDTRHPDEHYDIYPPQLRPTSHLRHGPARRHIKKSGEAAIVELIMQDVIFNGRVARLALTIDITERTRLAELTRRRELEFTTLVQNSPDIIARLDREFRHLYVNPAVGTAGNRRPAEYFIGKKVSEVGLPPDLLAVWDAALTRAFSLGTEQSLECVFETPSGPKYYESRIVPECDDHGAVTTVLTITRDFTDRRLAEQAAERTAALAQLLESLARAANEATTPEAGMVECLKLICTYGNWTIGRVALFGEGGPRDVAPQSMWYCAEPERFSRFMKISNERYPPMNGGPFLHRVLYEHEPVWIEDLAAVHMGRRETVLEHGLRSGLAFPIIIKGTIVAMMEVFSEARRPLDQLTMGVAQSLASQLARMIERDWANRSNARMAALVEASQDAIITRSLDGKILTWNHGAELLFGYTAAEAIGRDMSLIVPPELQQEIAMKRIAIHGGLPVTTYETIRLAKDGRRITVSASPTMVRDIDRGIWGVSTIMRDMTDRKQAEARRLAEVEKQRDALVREVHHRIKNSIQGVTGLLRQRLRGQVDSAPELESAIAQLQSVAAVYGLQSGVSSSVNLHALLQAIGSSAMHLTGGKISNVVEPGAAAHALIVETEAVAIAVLLNELIFNALKHSTGEPREVRVALRACEGGVDINVTNAGLLPAGFDLERGRGTGEGLNLVRTLIPHCCDLTIVDRSGSVEARLAVRSPVVFAVTTGESMSLTHIEAGS
jgi:PAS domain S-box-containing protein